MTDNFILKNRVPVPEPDLMKWAQWFEGADKRRVAKTQTLFGWVSTVFLGIDHSFLKDGPPILFETMIFRGPLDQEMDRYSTYEEAVQGHNRMVWLAWRSPLVWLWRRVSP